MALPRVTCVLEADNHLGEAPLWCPVAEALYWVNCEQPAAIHRWTPGSSIHVSWSMPQRAGGIVRAAQGRLLVTLADGLYDFDPASGDLALRVRSPLPAHVKLHECQCDRQGRLWVGAYDHHFTPTTRTAKGGAYFRLDGDVLTPVISGISVANGLAISPDGQTLYAADAPTGRVEAFDLDPVTGKISNGRLFLELAPGDGFVDGAAVDEEGGYWLAAVGAGALRRYRPDGSLDTIVVLPFSNPTKPAFGGPDLDVLYITSTRLPIGPANTLEAKMNGGLFSFRPGVRGVVEPVLIA